MSSETAVNEATAAARSGVAASGSQPVGAARRRGPFREGERVQLTDERGRMNTITLESGAAPRRGRQRLPALL
jgi:tRNA (adenine57-N1/adenine58-N1)-methyltransferase